MFESELEKSLWNEDTKETIEIAKWIDKNVYDVLKKSGHFNYKRIDDIDLQKKGIDVIINFFGNSYNIDEKINTHYKNILTRNQTIELDLLNFKDGYSKPVLGWGVDNKETDLLLFGWVSQAKNRATDEYCKLIKSEDIISMEFILCRLEDIYFKIYKSFGYTKERIIELGNNFRIKCENCNIKNKVESQTLAKGLSLKYSRWLPEKPINLLVDREILLASDIDDFSVSTVQGIYPSPKSRYLKLLFDNINK